MAIGGSFKHNVQKGDVPLAPKYHRWQSVDFSNPAYRRGQHSLDLNHPPTSVGGIWLGWASLCRPDFNNPPTAVGGIQLPLLIAPRAQCSLGLDEQHTDRIRRASSRSLRLTGGIMASVLISGFLKTIQRHFY